MLVVLVLVMVGGAGQKTETTGVVVNPQVLFSKMITFHVDQTQGSTLHDELEGCMLLSMSFSL